MRYDPDIPPSPSKWLALDEAERIALAERFHSDEDVVSPNIRVHAAIHATVETQLAMDLPSVVNALRRLQMEGLDRHEAIHAIGSVLAERIWNVLRAESSTGDSNAEYFAALDRLNAVSWRRDYGEPPGAR